MCELISVGARFVENASEMQVVIQEQTADRVVFSYEQHLNASHSYQRDAFIRAFSPVKAKSVKGEVEAAQCINQQAESILSMWLDSLPNTEDGRAESNLIAAVMTLIFASSAHLDEAVRGLHA